VNSLLVKWQTCSSYVIRDNRDKPSDPSHGYRWHHASDPGTRHRRKSNQSSPFTPMSACYKPLPPRLPFKPSRPVISVYSS